MDKFSKVMQTRQKMGMSQEPKIVYIGIGTPRRGSRSMTALLNKQKDMVCWDEMNRIQWEPEKWLFYYNLMKLLATDSRHVGDNGFYWLNYVEWLIEWERKILHVYRPVKMQVVCLRRGREETVDSLLRNIDPSDCTNFTSKESEHWVRYNQHHQWYPKYDLPNREAVEKYWDDYYVEAQRLCDKYPSKVRMWETDDALNNEYIQHDMLKWIGFDNPIADTTLEKGKGERRGFREA